MLPRDEDFIGGFRTDGPILDPLELLRLAGTRFEDLAIGEFCVARGRLLGDDSVEEVMYGLRATLRTVLAETELFRDDRELRKLVRELLRSTSLLAGDEAWLCASDFRNELVLLGMTVWGVGFFGSTELRIDRLLSTLRRFLSNRF